MDSSKNNNEVYKIFFKSLADESRLHIINAVRINKKNVQEICSETGLEQSLVSHHLKRLERCGMVFKEKKGKHRYFTVNHETIKPLMELIDSHTKQYCCHLLKGGHYQ
ncbi:winged helix-turn-helix transcriptional regulator [Candidatus Woesearchaeota archaeon]|nr:winged helix-turn-helix transcriptional regulator [Candidatus Woesearchaeota archaeon]